MNKVNPHIVLQVILAHDTLTINDLAKEENLRIEASHEELQPVLDQLQSDGLINTLDNVSPATYTITDKGIAEGARRNWRASVQQ
jgi:DNA-binding PadR family transcriptional regulator